jgi:hypothetical protein
MMLHRPVAISLAPFFIVGLVLIVVFRFVLELPLWRAAVYGAGIAIGLMLIAIVVVNWISS